MPASHIWVVAAFAALVALAPHHALATTGRHPEDRAGLCNTGPTVVSLKPTKDVSMHSS